MSTSNSISNTASSATPAADHPFVQLPRTPLVPERILRQYGAYCSFDGRFRSAQRLLQCLWLRDHDVPTAASQTRETTSVNPAPYHGYGSILSAEAANAGRNFLSPSIHRLALREWLLCEDGACIDEERLFGNALSSMPLVFNLFGPLALDLDLASAVFSRLLPGVVQNVERIQFETSPGRRDPRLSRRGEGPFLGDRSAYDCALHTIDPSGTRCIVYIEAKLSEMLDHGNVAKPRDRYTEASRQVRLYNDPDSLILRAAPIEQLWREGMLAQLAVDNGVTPRAVFLAVAPQLNSRVQAAFHVYQGELIDPEGRETDRVPFVPMTLETVVKAIADAGAVDHACALWDRYCDFERVYRLSMETLAGDASSAPTQTPTPSTNARPPIPPPTRWSAASTTARRSRAASSHPRGGAAIATKGTVERSTP